MIHPGDSLVAAAVREAGIGHAEKGGRGVVVRLDLAPVLLYLIDVRKKLDIGPAGRLLLLLGTGRSEGAQAHSHQYSGSLSRKHLAVRVTKIRGGKMGNLCMAGRPSYTSPLGAFFPARSSLPSPSAPISLNMPHPQASISVRLSQCSHGQ